MTTSQRDCEAVKACDRKRLRKVLVEYAATRSSESRDELVLAHLNVVRYLAARFANRGEPLDDLIQVGSIGLLKAIDRFDPKRGVEFITYAVPTILGEIKRHFRDKGWSLRVPRRLQDLSLAVNRVAENLSVEIGRSATVQDIAERLGASCEEIIEAQELGSAYCALSLDAQATMDAQSKPFALADRIGVTDCEFVSFENLSSLRRACKALDTQERVIMHLRFFDDLPQAEIARRLRVSQMQISRLQQRAIQKMRRALGGAGPAA
jgi:RNA polymerase sigma-B factor